MPFTYVKRQGRVYYLHVTLTRTGKHAEHRSYFFNQRAERALEQLPANFVLRGEVALTGVPVLKKVTPAPGGAPSPQTDDRSQPREAHW